MAVAVCVVAVIATSLLLPKFWGFCALV